ncbi:type II toxin-antitoxin system VapC family toxin [Synechocystis salina LEGE 06155]|nr:type II toxin-antitoxin system VapC family toxin [Synechocystis salina LEGE 06155]
MKLLLDTHTFIWWDSNPQKPSKTALTLLSDSNNYLFLSLVSVWEMQIKIQLDKLQVRTDLGTLIEDQLSENDLELLNVDLSHILTLSQLENHHRDPFDRLLIAQARMEKMTLISCDPIFQDYDCPIIW